jgi:hypothetical protein
MTALGAYKLARLCNLSRSHPILWSTVLATPLPFYLSIVGELISLCLCWRQNENTLTQTVITSLSV